MDTQRDRNGTQPSYEVRDLHKQIEALKKVIRDKNIQLNLVIKNAEEKYHDIHQNYRDLATQLHESWTYKYSKLEQENKELVHNLSYLREHSEEPPLPAVQQTDITKSFEMSETQFNSLTGGNLDIMAIQRRRRRSVPAADESHVVTATATRPQRSSSKPMKPMVGHRVVEAYID